MGTDMSRDFELARKAQAAGAEFSMRIVLEARRVNIPVSLGFALIEQESGFRNIFGHDPTIFVGAGAVTADKYRRYKAQRGPAGRGGMQGVGPAQLTWFAFQDAADRRGGCWVPRHNIAEAFDILASLIRAKGRVRGIAAYNGTGAAAALYSARVMRKMRRWHKALR